MASTPEQPTPALSVFDDAYASRTAPWVIGEPQPAIVTLERGGWVRGKVLDVGCGTGEHTIYLSALGYDVCGLDSSPRAVEQARANAAARNVEVHFQVADALALGDDTTYDTVIDSALFRLPAGHTCARPRAVRFWVRLRTAGQRRHDTRGLQPTMGTGGLAPCTVSRRNRPRGTRYCTSPPDRRVR
jgi:SAM-dependent methyltransferase